MNTDDTFTTVESYLLTKLPQVRDQIAALRDQGLHLTAGIMRDEMLSQIEAWLDPAGAAHTAALQAEQRASAGRLLEQIDAICGF
jgi:hypothetical protein